MCRGSFVKPTCNLRRPNTIYPPQHDLILFTFITEAGFTEEELQKLSGDEEISEGRNEAVVETDEDNSESSQSERSSVAEETDKTADVSGDTKPLKEVELDSEKKPEAVDGKSDDESENSGKTEVAVEEETDESEGTDSVEKTNPGDDSSVDKSDSLDEETQSPQKDPEESAAAETVDSTASGEHAEENLSETSDGDDDEKEDVDENDPKDEIIEDDERAKISDPETERDDVAIDRDAKTALKSADEDGGSSDQDKAVEDPQQSSNVSESESVEDVAGPSSNGSGEAGEVVGESEDRKPETRNPGDSQDEMKSTVDDPRSDTTSREEPVGKEDVSVEDKSQQEPEDESTRDTDKQEETTPDSQDGQTTREATLIEDENQETLSEDNVDEKKEDQPDAKGIFEAITSFLPSGGGTKENTKAQDETSDKVSDESTGVTNKQEETTQDSEDSQTSSEATLVDEKQETLSEENVDVKKDDQPDSERIFEAIKTFLPRSGSTEESTKSEEETSDKVLDVKKVKFPEKAEKVSSEGDGQEKAKDEERSESSEDVKGDLKSKQIYETNEANVNETDSVEEERNKDLDGSEIDDEEMAKKVIADLMDEESSSTKDATVSETETKAKQENTVNETDYSVEEERNKDLDGSKIDDEEMAKKVIADLMDEESSSTKDATVSETETKAKQENTVESGSTHFVNNTETTLPVEKTPDKEPEVSVSTSQGGEEIKTGMIDTETGVEETRTGVEETRTSVEETESGAKETRTGIEPGVVPTQTSTVGSSDTIAPGRRPFGKKFSNIAAKWRKNMKGKGMTEKETSEDKDEKLDSGNIEKSNHAGNTDESQGSEALDLEDPLSGTCAKDGSCDGTIPYSSGTQRSILEDDDDHDDDDIVEPSPPEEEPEAQSVKKQFLRILGVTLRKFREYHNLAAEYGLPMLKPFIYVIKPLAEQMDLGEVSVASHSKLIFCTSTSSKFFSLEVQQLRNQ